MPRRILRACGPSSTGARIEARPHSNPQSHHRIDPHGRAPADQAATTRHWLGYGRQPLSIEAVKESSDAGGTACAPQQSCIFKWGGGSACLARLRAFFSHLLAFALGVRRCVSIGARPRRYFCSGGLLSDDSQVRQHLRIGFVHRQQVVAGVAILRDDGRPWRRVAVVAAKAAGKAVWPMLLGTAQRLSSRGRCCGRRPPAPCWAAEVTRLCAAPDGRIVVPVVLLERRGEFLRGFLPVA